MHAMGLLPGEQNIHRAEICAILQAARTACAADCAAEIWTGSQVALREWERIKQGARPMWPDLAVELSEVCPDNITVHKIKAHKDLKSLWGMEQWLAAGNDLADISAKAALEREFDIVKDGCASTAEWQLAQRDALWVFWRFLLRLSLEENRLLKSLQRAETKGDDQPHTDGTGSQQEQRHLEDCSLERWCQLATGPWTSFSLPEVRREVLLACSWPPWFTWPLWQWCRSLQWATDEGTGRAKAGACHLELLVNFVLCTGVLPPLSLSDGARLEQAPRQFLQPVCLRALTGNLVAAVRQMERLSHRSMWPQRRKKCFALRELGRTDAALGVKYRPNFSEARCTGQMLQRVLKTSSAEDLLQHVTRFDGPYCLPSDVQRAWRLMTDAARTRLAREVRRT